LVEMRIEPIPGHKGIGCRRGQVRHRMETRSIAVADATAKAIAARHQMPGEALMHAVSIQKIAVALIYGLNMVLQPLLEK
jgi:hypothetical protein